MIRRMKNVMKTPYYDIIFVQREAFMTGSVFFEKRFSRSVAKFVFDFDDSIWLHDVSPANKTLAWLKKPDKTATIISLADCVIAGNEYLGSYAKKFNKNVWIIPTTIDTAYHRKVVVKKQADKICIGWTGTQTTIKHFETAINVLKKIKTKYGNKVYFIVISDMPDLTFEDIEIHSIPWQKETEIQDLCLFDIGLMPLPDDDWSKGKCGFKGLQYMALEIPAIMSAVGVNNSIIKNGVNGFLAKNEEDWISYLSQLIESKELRSNIGKAGRQTVIREFSVDHWKDTYLELLNNCLDK